MGIKVIAYYLPQYHPFKENDEWWGKGFTEWTNVVKAKPLFKGHYQPKIPADLGFYDLRLEESRIAQARLAKEAGIYGFCYWHYWFYTNKPLMERPFEEILETQKPDFPFCLGWANESWMAKLWNKDNVSGKTLIEQKYEGVKDYDEHFYYLLPAFKDNRYIKIDNKPFFLIYRPLEFPDVRFFMDYWNKLIKDTGIAESFYFVAHARNEDECSLIEKLGFDAINIFPLSRKKVDTKEFIQNFIQKFRKRITGIPRLIEYRTMIDDCWNDEYETKENILPTIIPNWDHSPRSGKHAIILNNSTPELWRKHIQKVFNGVMKKQNKVVMLKSWNEWGEGNYLEPDLKYGKAYLEIIKEELAHNTDNK